ncbi:MAG: DUF1836 domain-containing protein [Hyphomonadaceae bacterium]|nr:DUF1836 domain-containing protein [Clostridia bacterium]
MDKQFLDEQSLKEQTAHIIANNILYYEQLPQYDLFLSQVVDFLNAHFPEVGYTQNIVQNYIKNEVISAPQNGKKRGYTKQHLIQLALVSYMRPLLTADEIKMVFALAFNEINNPEDDLLSWEIAYKFFSDTQKDSLNNPFSAHILEEKKLKEILKSADLQDKNAERIYVFLVVMTLIAQAAATKKLVQHLVKDYQV